MFGEGMLSFGVFGDRFQELEILGEDVSSSFSFR